MKQPDYSIAVLRGDGVFGQLHGEWDELWEACPEATEAQTFYFQQLYRKHVARREQLLSVTARDGAGKLAALGVFAIRRDRQTLQLRLGFLGEHDVDYHGMLYREGLPEAVGRDMLAALIAVAGTVSAFEFLNVPEESWTRRVLQSCGEEFAGFTGPRKTKLSECYAVSLPGTMEEYWAIFGKKTRDRLKSKMRKFQRESVVEFRSITEDIDLGSVLDDVEAVERARWGGGNQFGDDASRDFLRGMITALVRERRCRVFTLHADGQCVSYIVGFIQRGALRIPYLAHDISLAGNHSVGLICNIMAIELCIGEGYHDYDLTRGSEGYKAQLGGELRYNVSDVIFRNSTCERLADFNRRFLAPILHSCFMRRLRRLVRR